uniref:PE-PGRS family protein n=1 Tax=Parastrongyloides trichosuri TaxID=131310 RepID=A0A0N4Z8I3_PARTI
MIIEHPVDHRGCIRPRRDDPTRARRHPIVMGKVHASQFDGLGRRRAGHRTHLDGRYHAVARARHREVQVIVQRRRRRVLALQQLREVQPIGTRGKVGHLVVASIALLPQEGIAARATGQGIVSRPADQQIVTTAPDQDVVAKAADQRVGVVVAGQLVVVVGADQVLDRHQLVEPGADRVLLTGQRQAHRHPSARPGVAGGVVASATVEQIVAVAADQQVVAIPPVELVVAIAANQHVVACTAIENVITAPGQQHVVVAGAFQGTAGLVGDVHRPRGAAAMAVADGIGAVVGGRVVMRPGVVDRHVQLVAFCALAAVVIDLVDQMDAVHPIMAGGETAAIGDGMVGAALILPLHQQVAISGAVVVQGQGFALAQAYLDHVFVIAIGSTHRPQVATDHQRRGHRPGCAGKGTARQNPLLIGQRVVLAGEGDDRLAVAGREIRPLGPAGVEGDRRRTQAIVVGVAVVGQQGGGRHADARRKDIGDDMIGTGHRRSIGVDVDHQVGTAQVAVVVAGHEADGLHLIAAAVLGRRIGELAVVHVHHQRPAQRGLDRDAVGARVEGAAVCAATGCIAGLVGVAFGVEGVSSAVDQQRLDEATIGTEVTTAHQAAGDRRALHGARQHVVQLRQVGDHHRVGIGVGTAVIGSRVEIAGVDAAAQPDRIRLDAVVAQEVLPVAGARFGQGMPRGRRTVREEVADALRPLQLARRLVGRLRHVDCRVVIGRATRGQVLDQGLGLGHRHPHVGAITGTGGERDDLHLHIAHVVVLVQQCADGLLGQLQARQAAHPGIVGHAAGHIDDQHDVGVHLPRCGRAHGVSRCGHVIDDIDHDVAGGRIAGRIGGLVDEGLAGDHVGAVVEPACGFGCGREGVLEAAVGVELNLPIGARAAAHQRIAGVAAGHGAGGEVVRVLAKVQGLLVHRDLVVGAGDDLAVGDIDGDGGGAFVAVRVTNGVGEGVLGTVLRHRIGVGLVLGLAIGIQDQRAIGAGDAHAQRADGRGRGVGACPYTHHRTALGCAVCTQGVVVQHVAGDRTALHHRGAVRLGPWHVVHDLDHDGAGDAVAQRVGGLVGEGLGGDDIGPVVAVADVRRRGQGVLVAAVGIDLNLPVGAGAAAHQREGQRAGATTDRAGQRSGRGLARRARVAAHHRARRKVLRVLDQVQGLFIHRDAVRAGDELAVGDIDGDGRGAFVTVRIADGVGEHVLGAGWRYRVGVGLVDRLAIGVEHQRAVGTRNVHAQRADGRCRGIGAGPHTDHRVLDRRAIGAQAVIVQHVAGDGTAFDHRGAVGPGLRHVIDNVHVQAAGGLAAIAVDGHHAEALTDVVDALASGMSFVVEQGVAVAHHACGGVVAGDGEGIAQPCGDRLREATDHPADHHVDAPDGKRVQAIGGMHGKAAALGQRAIIGA